MLARRELCAAQLRDRLRRKGFDSDIVDQTLDRLRAEGVVDDRRTAALYARRAALVSHRGRVRATREIEARGIDRSIARAAVAEVYAEIDDRALVARALARRLTGSITDPRQFRRLSQYLLRQGFDAGLVLETLRAHAAPAARPDDDGPAPSRMKE